MPGLILGMARTAAPVGTATATRNAVNRRQADKNAQAMRTLRRPPMPSRPHRRSRFTPSPRHRPRHIMPRPSRRNRRMW